MTDQFFSDRFQFLVRLGYVGSKFYGVQEQPHLPTVLGALRKRIEDIAGQRARALCMAARTDRGVHALENYATFFLRAPLDRDQFIERINAHSGDNLLSVDVKHVSPHVHARGNSRSKIYRYHIVDSSSDDFEFAWGIAPPLNVDVMRQAAAHLVGTKDFSSLRGGGCEAGTTVKEIFYITVERYADNSIVIEIKGNAFLRKMIRNLVGLLVEVGTFLRAPDDIPEILAKMDRNAAGIMAPAHGLFLAKIDFDSP